MVAAHLLVKERARSLLKDKPLHKHTISLGVVGFTQCNINFGDFKLSQIAKVNTSPNFPASLASCNAQSA